MCRYTSEGYKQTNFKCMCVCIYLWHIYIYIFFFFSMYLFTVLYSELYQAHRNCSTHVDMIIEVVIIIILS